MNAVVTSGSVIQAQVQSATSAVASSADASPATSSSAPAGTVPSPPTVTAITPTNGAAGGGNDVKITGTGLNAATAIEIGTAAQFSAGTPTTVVLCASSAPGCFAVTASTTTVAPGGTVTYTITATNSGQTALTGATFTDPLTDVLDDANYNSDASATAGSVSFASPNLTWTGNLAVGASATITFSVTVKNPDTGNKTLASTVTSTTSSSNCGSGSTDTRCASTVTVLVPGLTTTVSAGTSTTNPGQTVTYTITVTNSGQTAYTGATFTNPLGGLLDDSTYNNDAAATAGSVSFASSALTWTGNLAVGATATVTFSVTVKDPDTGDKVLVDTITSTTAGSNCPAGSTDSRCTATVPVLVSGLQISASAGSATTTPGSVVQYTVTVTNSGQTAYTGATFTDPLSGCSMTPATTTTRPPPAAASASPART